MIQNLDLDQDQVKVIDIDEKDNAVLNTERAVYAACMRDPEVYNDARTYKRYRELIRQIDDELCRRVGR